MKISTCAIVIVVLLAAILLRLYAPKDNFILTGYPADESFRRANGHDVAHYFTKPVEIEEMIETINKKLAPRDSRAAD